MLLTNNQKLAINKIDNNILVNAGAGSGKTRVLVERYINILENGDLVEGKEVESIVAITFTKKAQGEMKERIRERVKENMNENKKWKRIYEDLEKANISTIHGFCSKILSENPIESDIYPNFDILDEYKKKKFINESIEDILFNYIENDKDIYNLLEYFTPLAIENSLFSDNLIDTIREIYLKTRTTGLDINKLEKITLDVIDKIEVDLNHIAKIKDTINYLMDNVRKNSKIYKMKQSEVWSRFNNTNYQSITSDLLEDLLYIKDNLGTNKKYQEYIDEIIEKIYILLQIIDKRNRGIYIGFFKVLYELDIKYKEKKDKVNALDFEDLQILTLKLFQNEDILNMYHNKYKYIMVDEFQDTDSLQKKILYKLCSVSKDLDRNNLFVVGDPKQSIYRFRGAELSVFDEVHNDIAKKKKERIINLDENFRTVETIMNTINQLFTNLMKGKYQKLNPNKESKSNIDVEILKNDNVEIPDGVTPSEYNRKYEADLIAKRIKQIVKDGNYNYSDITILFRSMTYSNIFEESLIEHGIPYYNLSGGGLFDTQEIKDVLNGIKSINNKHDLLSLVGFLRSPMVGISDETVYKLFNNTTNNVLENMRNISINLSNSEKIKINNAYRILNRLNKIKEVQDVYSIVKDLIDSTNYIETNMLKHNNKQIMANIYKFLDFTKNIVIKEKLNIREFINHIEDLINYTSDESQGVVDSETGNTTKLMSIHKSKGLQFKVVIIPETSKKFNLTYPRVVFDKNEGLAIKHPDRTGKPSSKLSPLYKKLHEKYKIEELEENKRILYVAMTRTEEKLIIGSQKGDKNYKESFKHMIENNILTDNVRFIEEIDVQKENITKIKTLEDMHLKKSKVDYNILPEFSQHDDYRKKDFKTFSISQYMTFKKCPRKFYLTYYRRLPSINYIKTNDTKTEPSFISPVKRGEIVHRVCELYDNTKDVDSLIKDVLFEYDIDYSENILSNIQPYIENYRKIYDDSIKEYRNELEFYYNIGKAKIFGIIDRINIKKQKVEIIDFKTNKVINKEKLKNEYKSQIQLYTSAIKDIYDLEISKAGLMLLDSGEFIEINISENELIKNKEEVNKFIEFVLKNNNIEAYKPYRKKCKYCDFNNICTE